MPEEEMMYRAVKYLLVRESRTQGTKVSNSVRNGRSAALLIFELVYYYTGGGCLRLTETCPGLFMRRQTQNLQTPLSIMFLPSCPLEQLRSPFSGILICRRAKSFSWRDKLTNTTTL